MKLTILFLSVLVLFSQAHAQVIAPSAAEMIYSYQTKFITTPDDSVENLAYAHSQYLFGVFHSPFVIGRFGLNPDKVGGIGAPSSDPRIRILKATPLDNGRVEIEYSLQARVLVHSKVAETLLSRSVLELYMPLDIDRVYLKKCTDAHYDSVGDYWYFWDPYRAGCEALQRSPATQRVQIQFAPIRARKMETRVRLDLLRANNDNGENFVIYALHGFEDNARNSEDAGRANYKLFNEDMQKRGFEKTVRSSSYTNPWIDWSKRIQMANGKDIAVTVRSLLVNTTITSRSTAFARFFKDAVAEADVIIYLGHSGLGGNLDIPALESKVGRFEFNPRKRQIFYFDSCSSYSYYLKPFAAEKTRAKIDIMTNGLSSYFHTTPDILGVFMNYLLSPTVQDVEWQTLLKEMERPLRGGSYLLNVGGV